MPLFNFYTPPTKALPEHFLILSSAYKNEHIDKKKGHRNTIYCSIRGNIKINNITRYVGWGANARFATLV